MVVVETTTKLHVLLTFDRVHRSLHLQRKATPEPSKVVRTCGAFNVLTWTRASRHNGVHLFDISTSKSGPSMLCFEHFDLEMCFAPKRRAIFHLCSGQISHGSAPAALASRLFDPPEPQIIGFISGEQAATPPALHNSTHFSEESWCKPPHGPFGCGRWDFETFGP